LLYNAHNRICPCKFQVILFQVILVNFTDYFGPHWHFYLGHIIASIPVPWKLAKGVLLETFLLRNPYKLNSPSAHISPCNRAGHFVAAHRQAATVECDAEATAPARTTCGRLGEPSLPPGLTQHKILGNGLDERVAVCHVLYFKHERIS